MALAGSLQFSPLLGFCRNRERSRQFKYVSRRANQDVLATSLSSCASRQDSLSRHLSGSTSRPICILTHRRNALRCHSFLFFGHNVTIPTVKTATAALTRSSSTLQSSSLVTKLVPAVGIILFALWGLGPLLRLSRNIFLRKTDSSWKKSTTKYVMTSYLQPILLWTGATLICRALAPITMPTDASQLVKQRLLTFVQSLSTVLAFAYCLSSMIQQAHKYFMETNDPTDTRNMGFQFAGKAVYTAVWVAAVSLFMELLGFSTQRWVTAGGLGTVLLTLAGREIFTNFLSSAMIHATRPFVLNEWIQTKIEGYEVSGTVEHVGWWSPTIIRGEDREAVHIPNHKFTVNVVRNLTQKTHWRIKTHLAISHLDVSKINNIVADMRKVLAKNPQVEQQKLHRRVFLENINPENQALMILISCFVKTSHFEEYLCVKEAILLDLLRVISHHRARLATPIRTIQKYYSETELESMSFPEAMFGRSGPASKRPMLLIDSYKVNGEDKSKPQARSAHSNRDQDSRNTGQMTAEPKADSKVKGTSTPELDSKDISKSGNKSEGKVAETSNVESRIEVAAASKSDVRADDKATVKAATKTSLDSESVIANKGVAASKSDVRADDKATVKAATKTSSDSESVIANKGVAASKSDPRTDGKATVKAVSKTSSESDSFAANTSRLDVKGTGSTVDGKVLKSSENSQPKGRVESKSVDEKSSSFARGSESKPVEKSPASEPSKPAPDSLEENIVLGVALEGSKRTLPIEEGLDSPLSTPGETKELAARSNGNGNGNSAADKDEKDK